MYAAQIVLSQWIDNNAFVVRPSSSISGTLVPASQRSPLLFVAAVVQISVKGEKSQLLFTSSYLKIDLTMRLNASLLKSFFLFQALGSRGWKHDTIQNIVTLIS